VHSLADQALGYLEAEALVEARSELLYGTDFGKRVSMLYIDPATGVMFKEALKHAGTGISYTTGLLHLAARCPDFSPKFPLRGKDFDTAIAFMEEHGSELLDRPSRRTFSDFDQTIQEMRTVMALYGWIDEWREEQLLSRLGVEPGDMHRAVDNAEWLLHSLGELAKLFKKSEMAKQTEVLRLRVEAGVSEELLELTTLEGIGRVRARALYTAGFRSFDDLKDAPTDKLAAVDRIGTSVARRIKEQLSRH